MLLISRQVDARTCCAYSNRRKRCYSVNTSGNYQHSKRRRTSSAAGRFYLDQASSYLEENIITSMAQSEQPRMVPNQASRTINGMPWSSFSVPLYRLRTFLRYPWTAVKSASQLVANGFVYLGTGEDDKVQCAYCLVIYTGWQRNDDIQQVHRRLSPSCPMVQQNSVENETSVHNLQLPNASSSSSPEVSVLSIQNGPQNGPDLETDSVVESDPQLEQPEPLIHREPYPSQPETTRAQQETVQRSTPESEPSTQVPASTSSRTTSFPIVTSPLSTEEASPPGSIANGSSNLPLSPPSPSEESDFTSTPVSAPSTTTTSGTSPNAPNTEVTPSTSSSPSQSQTPRPTWIQMGITIERPKNEAYTRKEARLQTFSNWPTGHSVKVDDLVEAGFYYAGYSDCARCFFCGGGLRNWEDGDDAFVEHARWFSKCAYIRSTVKPEFREAVSALHDSGKENVTLENVLNRIGMDREGFLQESEWSVIEKDAGVKALIEVGYDRRDVLNAAKALCQENESEDAVCAEALLKKLIRANTVRKPRPSPYEKISTLSSKDKISEIDKTRQTNCELRRERTCKVCLTGPLTVLFLPCGHLACCSVCSNSLKACPVCRNSIKGTVRVTMSY